MSHNDNLTITPLQDLSPHPPTGPSPSLPSSPPPSPTTSASDPFPEGGLRAWLVVAGAFSVIAGSFGLQSSIGVFQSYWLMHQLRSYSSSEIGWISAVNIFLTLFLGVQIGPLFDRYGPRWLLLSGSVVYVASLFVLAECTLYWHFMAVFGVVAGVCGALLTTTAVAVVAHWFEVKRGMANGVVFIGSSLGGIVIPLIMKPLLDRLGWAWAMRVLALIITLLMVLGNICIRGRLPKGKMGGTVDLRCFLDTRFTWATVGIAGAEFVLFGTLGLISEYTLAQGFSSQASFNVLAVLNAGSAIGRYSAGWFSDSFGRFNTMVVTSLFAVTVVFATWLPISVTRSTGLLYLFAALFGLGSGSIISLAPVCFGQLCKADEYGKFYGTSYSVVSFATLICIPIGGALIPTIGSEGFVTFFGGILILSSLSFMMTRWACLDYHWQWKAKV